MPKSFVLVRLVRSVHIGSAKWCGPALRQRWRSEVIGEFSYVQEHALLLLLLVVAGVIGGVV